MLHQVVRILATGIDTPRGRLTATTAAGRFPEEERLTLYLTMHDSAIRVLTAIVYHGWKTYAPWAELTRITPELHVGDRHVGYYGSSIEDRLLTLFADAVEPPGHLFVSYETDTETARALTSGVPAPATRLGFELFRRGFTWYKDWYHPEGWREGGQKLQAEKPLDEQHRRRHHEAIQQEIKDFLATDDTDDVEDTAAVRRRASSVLGCLDI